jgi:TonB-dependent receptor
MNKNLRSVLLAMISMMLMASNIAYSWSVSPEQNHIMDASDNKGLNSEVPDANSESSVDDLRGDQVPLVQIRRTVKPMVTIAPGNPLFKLTDANPAETTGRLAGVTVIRQAGEGHNVVIRGLAPQYNQVLWNGHRIPSTGLDDRLFDMRMISSELVSDIELYKVPRPDMDADAIGGLVNLKMAEVPDEQQLHVSLSSGYHTHINELGTYKGSIKAGGRFLNNKFGVLGIISSQRNDRSFHSLNSGYQVLDVTGENGESVRPVPSRLRLTDQQAVHENHQIALALDADLPYGRLTMSNVYSRFTRESLWSQREYRISNNEQLWNYQNNNIENELLLNSLSGEHSVLGDAATVQWQVSRSASNLDIPHLYQLSFQESFAMVTSPGETPEELSLVPDLFVNNIGNTVFQNGRWTEMNLREVDLAASVDIKVPFLTGNEISGFVKTGGKYSDKTRKRNNSGWQINALEAMSLMYNNDEFTFPWEVVRRNFLGMAPFTSPEAYSVLNGQYEMHYQLDHDLLDAVWDTYSGVWPRSLATEFYNYEASENISAAYAMTELNVGERLMIRPGIRYEFKKAVYETVQGMASFNSTVSDEDFEDFQNSLNHRSATRREHMWFPMVLVRLTPVGWLDVHTSISQSMARPAYSDVIPYSFVSEGDEFVTRGNLLLESPKSTNYDVQLTLHAGRHGRFTFGGFYKEIENLIYRRNVTLYDPEMVGVPLFAYNFQLSEPYNNPFLATIHGFEAEWHSNLTWLPGILSGLVVNANIARMFSETEYPEFVYAPGVYGLESMDTTRTGPIVHQPDYVANLSLGYNYSGFSARIAMHFQGKTYHLVGTRAENDVYIDAFQRLDLALKQNLFGGMAAVTFNVHNLSNRREKSWIFTGNHTSSMEYYGMSVNMGLQLRL